MSRSATKPAITKRCRSCGAVVVWASPAPGTAMLFDAAEVAPAPGRWVIDERGRCQQWRPMFDGYDTGTYVPHWATCPDADDWRQRGFPQLQEETSPRWGEDARRAERGV